MARNDPLFSIRKPLNEICKVPDKIISVYSLEKHVWADSNSDAARKTRKPELKTIQEFQIDPVRPFLNDILRMMAAPYKADQRENPIGQGYWIQAEFGSGKSHLLSFLSALVLGNQQAWDLVDQKEKQAGRGKRDSIYRFWEEGLQAKGSGGKKGVLVVVKTLVGSGGGAIGLQEGGRRLTEYILDAVKEQLYAETGKNMSLYPTELLADRFLSQDLERYRNDLKKFLRDPKYWADNEMDTVENFVRDIQKNETPKYKESVGNKLWRFYNEYLQVDPHIVAETEEVLKHMVQAVLNEGYSGILLVLDEVSLFMMNRTEEQKWEDAKALVVLSNRIAKVYNLPVWTVCSAQQAIEAHTEGRNIIADDRLKLVKLLENAQNYYDIVLARVREITNPQAISSYYQFYKRGFTWPSAIGEAEFAHFFPFHKPALEVLRDVSYNLTTTRSAIAVMHQVLRHQISHKGNELIRLWELFDETVRYEEDPSGTYASLATIRSKYEQDYRAYEACKRQIESITKGLLKIHRDKGVKVIQTLFLYHVAKTRQQGLTSEDISNSVLIERAQDASPDENQQHYEQITESLRKELPQIAVTADEDGHSRYRFNPIPMGKNPNDEFQKARASAEGDELAQLEAWKHLLGLDEWPVRTRTLTMDLSHGVKSRFAAIAPFDAPWRERAKWHREGIPLNILWRGREITGWIEMRDLAQMAAEDQLLQDVSTSETDQDFRVVVSTRPVSPKMIAKLLNQRKDPRILLWTPAELTQEERSRLLDFAGYRKLIAEYGGKETEDALAILQWVNRALESDMGRCKHIVDASYARGRLDARDHTEMAFTAAGELPAIIAPLAGQVLDSVYESRDISFETNVPFGKEDAVKVINGIVRTGGIPKNTKPNQFISAADNFGVGLKIVKRGAERTLDTSTNSHVRDLWNFVDGKLPDGGQTMKIETLYKNFMGIGGLKNYGLTRRMIQLYLLCLVREGKVRVEVSQRAKLQVNAIDSANIADIDFSVKVLDALTNIQKMVQPENWEVLRPYAEKLLGEMIPANADDATATSCRRRLHDQFLSEKSEAARVRTKVVALFDAVKAPNPYATELDQMARIFDEGTSGEDEIDSVLDAFKRVLGYKVFDEHSADAAEVGDLANRLKNYRDLANFAQYDAELRAAHAHCHQPLPEGTEFKTLRRQQQQLVGKMANLRPYIDQDVRLKTELIGQVPPQPGESGTLSAFVQEYTSLYAAMHDRVLDCVQEQRERIQALLAGDELKALRMLEQINALQPPVADALAAKLGELQNGLFACPEPSRTSLDDQLRRGPLHECGLSFQNASDQIKASEKISLQAVTLMDAALESKAQVFFSQAVRQRLEQGQNDPLIAGILKAANTSDLRAYLVAQCLAEPHFVDAVTRYLKKITVKRIRIADFRPSMGTVEKDQIPELVLEFQRFLEKELDSIGAEEATLPMLQIE